MKLIYSSSMNSVSTNPFEDDEDEEIEEHMEMATSNNLEVTKVEKITKRRKKRRAPPPPPSQQQMVIIVNFYLNFI